MRHMRTRVHRLLLVALLALDLFALVGLAYYTSDMTGCWNLADSGLLIGCGPHVPNWGWAMAVTIAIALCGALLWQRQSTRVR